MSLQKVIHPTAAQRGRSAWTFSSLQSEGIGEVTLVFCPPHGKLEFFLKLYFRQGPPTWSQYGGTSRVFMLIQSVILTVASLGTVFQHINFANKSYFVMTSVSHKALIALLALFAVSSAASAAAIWAGNTASYKAGTAHTIQALFR